MQQSVQEVLENIEVSKLPSFPHVLVKLLEACQRPDSTIEHLSGLIHKDTGLCAKVIAAANSPFYGLRNPVRSLERTLVVLGMDTIKTIAIASAVHQFFANLNPDRGAFLKNFWRHSMLCATLARNLAKIVGYGSRDEAYLAGLLHDVGKLVLLQRFGEKYGAVQALSEEQHDLIDQEREHFGVAHQEVGFWLIRNWHLDSFLADAVLYHHEASESLLDAHALVRIVHVANRLALTEHTTPARGAEAAQRLFGLTHEMSAELHSAAAAEVRTIAASLDIDLEPAESYERRQAVQAQDAAVYDRLAAEVRNIGLLDGVRQQLGRSAGSAALEAVRDSARLLFDVHRPLLFLVSEDGQRLQGVAFGSEDALVGELDLAVASEQSLLCQALRTQTLCSSADANGAHSIVDQEILNLSQREIMVIVPVWGNEGASGVLVFGANASQAKRYVSQRSLLGAFGAEVGRALEANRLRERERRDSAEECRAQFELRARTLAHETNNPLAVMQNYLHLLGAKLDQGHPAQADLEVIREEVARVGALIQGMSQAKAEEPGGDELNLNRTIEDLVRVFQRSLLEPAGIQATLDLDSDLPVLLNSRSAFKQVLVNLLKNAAEAMSDGGSIAVETRDHVNFDGSQYVEISIQDSGPGIPAEILKQLFQPVQTTKGTGHAGLGLTIVNSLVKEMGGMISCRSEATGTRFQILLPRKVAPSV